MIRSGWAGAGAALLLSAAAVGAALTVGGGEPRGEPQAGVESSGARRSAFRAPPAGLLADAEAAFAAGLSARRSSPLGPVAPAPQDRECVGRSPDRFYEFYFTRAIYSNYRGGGGNRGFGGRNFGGGSWSVDYPKADCQFITVVQRLAGLDMFWDSNAINLDDPAIRGYPFLYALEVGGMSLSDEEVQGLRSYLAAGGFLVIDDFWGTREWENFAYEIQRVLPGRPIVDVPMSHTVFNIFYTIDRVLQVPNERNGRAVHYGVPGASTHEGDGYVPYVKGIFDDKGRLMVIINWNTDLGDAWEWAEQADYPLEFSTFAFEMGVNMILYSMTH